LRVPDRTPLVRIGVVLPAFFEHLQTQSGDIYPSALSSADKQDRLGYERNIHPGNGCRQKEFQPENSAANPFREQ